MSDAQTDAAKGKSSWFQRLKSGLARSSSRLSLGIGDLFSASRLDETTLEELQDLLISVDLGVSTATRLTEPLAKRRFDKTVSPLEIRELLASEAANILTSAARPFILASDSRPHVVLMVGVNGAGKTTTIGKIAHQFVSQGKRVRLAAGDTFRAAAVEQLKIWGERAGCPVEARETGADAAGLAYDAFLVARAQEDDLLLIDTAGRLQNKTGLMDELAKIKRVLQKLDPAVPHSVLLVLDATVGQNAHQQVEVFKKSVDVSGLIVTKLDGAAKGGVVVALAERFGLPIHYVGVGEGIDDLRPFEADAFARGLMGLD